MDNPTIYKSDDGSVVFQWHVTGPGYKRRAALTFEVDPKESGWHCVSVTDKGTDKSLDVMVCGSIQTVNMKQIERFLEDGTAPDQPEEH